LLPRGGSQPGNGYPIVLVQRRHRQQTADEPLRPQLAVDGLRLFSGVALA
jgi:hypothetical protein